MIDFGIKEGDYVCYKDEPDMVFTVFEVNEVPASRHWARNNAWKPNARIHYAGGRKRQFSWEYLARYAPLEDLRKLTAMEVVARMADE